MKLLLKYPNLLYINYILTIHIYIKREILNILSKVFQGKLNQIRRLQGYSRVV